jgi:hypothetical protein
MVPRPNSPQTLPIKMEVRRASTTAGTVIATYTLPPGAQAHNTLCRMPAALDKRVRNAAHGALGAGVIGMALWALGRLEEHQQRLVVKNPDHAPGTHGYALTLETKESGQELVQVLVPTGPRTPARRRGAIGVYLPSECLSIFQKSILGAWTVGISGLCEYALDTLQAERLQLIIT